MKSFDLLAQAPEELLLYLDAAQELADKLLGIRPLNRDSASEYAADIQQTSLGEALGLVPLEDAGNSRPYCYITRGPATGLIFAFNSGKPEPFRFPDLNAFVEALQAARLTRTHIEDLPAESIPAIPGQQGLCARLLGALELEPREAEATIDILLPLLAPANLQVLGALAGHDNSLIRESVAVFLQRRTLIEHEAIAQRLAADAYSQVAFPAAAALMTIRRLKIARNLEEHHLKRAS